MLNALSMVSVPIFWSLDHFKIYNGLPYHCTTRADLSKPPFHLDKVERSQNGLSVHAHESNQSFGKCQNNVDISHATTSNKVVNFNN